ncbi:importin subunit alpha-like isoform X3 [Cherax quadricarinatus]|uniref:importin subunit alpha-like isoform X3 n=1 Tax=Cherax quadricarinatus TaxID=27406 RepID=UPI00387EBBE6
MCLFVVLGYKHFVLRTHRRSLSGVQDSPWVAAEQQWSTTSPPDKEPNTVLKISVLVRLLAMSSYRTPLQPQFRTSMESPEPLTRRDIMDINTSQLEMDLESIRVRRAHLKALTASVRLPPLIPPDEAESRPSSRYHHDSTRSISSGERYMLHRQKSEQKRTSKIPVTSARTRSANIKLPKLTVCPMARSHHIPLPEIGHIRKMEEEASSMERTNTESSSPATNENVQLVSTKPEDVSQKSKKLQLKDVRKVATPASGKRKTPISSSPGVGPQVAAAKCSCSSRQKTPKNQPEVTEDIKEDITKTVSDMSSKDLTTRLQATTKARRMLSMETDPPIDEFLAVDVLTPAMNNLQHENSTLVYETVWIITNISSGSSLQTHTVVERGFIGPLVGLLTTNNNEVREQATWALGNIMGDGAEFRNMVVAAGVIKPLLSLLDQGLPISFVRNISWLLSNLLRYKPLPMSEEEHTFILKALKEHLLIHNDSEVCVDALWAVSYYADMDNTHIQQVVEAGIIPLLMLHLNSDNRLIVQPAIRTIGIMTSGTDVQTDVVLEAGILAEYSRLLTKELGVRKEIAWGVSNILAGTRSQIQSVVKSGIIQELIKAAQKDEISVKKEVIWALSNMTQGGTQAHIEAVVGVGGLQLLVDSLLTDNVNIVLVAAEGIKNMLEKFDNVEKIKAMIEEYGGVDYMETNLQHVNDEVGFKMNDILNTYFPDPSFTFPTQMKKDFYENTDINQSLSRKATKYVAELVSP